MSNIQEIAKIAGVSSATVSRVINQSGYVSETTRKKVEAAIQQLDYVPNNQAVFLKKGKTKTLGILATSITDTIMVFVNNFTLAAQKKGYTIILYLTEENKQKELNALEMLRRKQIDGIFLLLRSNDWPTIESYTKYGPIVAWERIESDTIPSIFIDQYHGYLLGLEYLYSTGCRNIVNLYSNMERLNTRSRIKAYEHFCQKHGLRPHAPEKFDGLNSVEDGERMAHWWQKQDVRPDGFMTSSDILAAGLVTEARRLGFSVPNNFSVIGFDNIETSYLLDITTIDYSIPKQAENAFKLIYQKLTGQLLPLQDLDFTLITRKTTK